MRRLRITITIDKSILEDVDHLVDKEKIRNRSHALEYVLNQYFHSAVKRTVILAGGQGTKLRPYTYEVPKSLLPIKGRPILEYIIENLKKHGITDIILSVGYLGEKIKAHFGDGRQFGVKITYSQEKKPLQTGGALLKAKKLLGDQSFFVIHGDVLSNLSLKDIVVFHNEQKKIGTIALTTVDHPTPFGQLKLHGTTLVDFYQKRPEIKSHLVNSGIYLFEPEIFNFFPKQKEVFLLEDVVQKLISEKKISGFVFEEQWFDVGTSENYERAIKEFRLPDQK